MSSAAQSSADEQTHRKDEPQPKAALPGKAGGWKSIMYIIGNESFEKLASMSLIANITVYLLSQYNLQGIYVVNVVNIWSGTSNIASLAGSFFSDAYLGRFKTLLFGTLASLLGMSTVTLTACLDQLRPPVCTDPPHCQHPQGWQLGILFVGLGLLSVGAGGIRPCNIAFGADQFDTTTETGRKQLESFFHWWYFTFTIALVLALTVVVYVQTNISWIWGFAIPTACLAFSISVFLLGRHTYVYVRPEGSIFTDLAKVVTAACRKRRVQTGTDANNSFYNPASTANRSDSQKTRIVHSDRFKFLDKAAVIVSSNELDDQGMPRNEWKLCSLQQVEHLKCLIAVLPVWVTAVCCFIIMDQQNTFGVLQTVQMNRSVGHHFQVPPGWMNLISMISLSIWIVIYECIYTPLANKITRKDHIRLTMRQRITIGILMSILCMVFAGIVETKRRDMALKHRSLISSLSFALLIPQYVLSGLTEAFAAVAMMEFFTVKFPESMRTVAGAVFFLSLSMASYIGSFIVNIIHNLTKVNGGNEAWLGSHDLNMNKLDRYYYVLAGIGFVNLVYFHFFASQYVKDCGTGISRREEKLELSATFHAKRPSESTDEEKGLGIRGSRSTETHP